MQETLSAVGSLPKCPEEPGLDQTDSKIPEHHLDPP